MYLVGVCFHVCSTEATVKQWFIVFSLYRTVYNLHMCDWMQCVHIVPFILVLIYPFIWILKFTYWRLEMSGTVFFFLKRLLTVDNKQSLTVNNKWAIRALTFLGTHFTSERATAPPLQVNAVRVKERLLIQFVPKVIDSCFFFFFSL